MTDHLPGDAAQQRAGGSDSPAYRHYLVAGEIVHDLDIAFGKLRDAELPDIGEETLGVDQPVEHARSRSADCRRGRIRLIFAARRQASANNNKGWDALNHRRYRGSTGGIGRPAGVGCGAELT